MTRANTPPVTSQTRWGWNFALLSVIVVVGAIVRVIAATDQMWMDELWSLLMYANNAQSAWQIVSSMQDSNNQQLVTLWMYVCGADVHWFVYRIPSLLAGIGTIVLAARFANRWGSAASLLAALLTASSFLLVTYASEARGYALSGFFSLLGVWCVERFLATRGWAASLGFAVAVLLGLLSHLTFLFFYGGVGVWSLMALVREIPDWRGRLLAAARLHVPAVLGVLVFYWVCLRDYAVGGAPSHTVSKVVNSAFLLAAGGRSESPLVLWTAMIVVLALILGALWLLYRSGDDLWAFFAVTIVALPALMLLSRPSALAERFFYVPTVYFLVLMAYLLSQVWRWSLGGPAIVVIMLVLSVGGNVYWTHDFLTGGGRGQYLQAMRYICEHTEGDKITLTSDHDFRNGLALNYYGPYLPDQRNFVYYTKVDAKHLPEWRIFHAGGRGFRASPAFVDRLGNKYELKQVFRCSGLSGFHWVVYQLVAAKPVDAAAMPRNSHFRQDADEGTLPIKENIQDVPVLRR